MQETASLVFILQRRRIQCSHILFFITPVLLEGSDLLSLQIVRLFNFILEVEDLLLEVATTILFQFKFSYQEVELDLLPLTDVRHLCQRAGSH